MSFEAWLMLAILMVMFALLIWNRLPAWIVFTGTVAVAMTLRLAPRPLRRRNGWGTTCTSM